jgi:hypothetical protein
LRPPASRKCQDSFIWPSQEAALTAVWVADE